MHDEPDRRTGLPKGGDRIFRDHRSDCGRQQQEQGGEKQAEQWAHEMVFRHDEPSI